MSWDLCELYMAEKVGKEEIRGGEILIVKELPKSGTEDDWQEKRVEMFREEAKKLYQVLAKNLPGGTLSALLIRLLEEKACVLRMPVKKGS